MSGFGGGGSSAASTGSWTPAITFGGGAVGLTYSARSGLWYSQQISGGELLIDIFGNITLSALGSSTGLPVISGLPYAIKNNSTLSYAMQMNFSNYSGMSSFTEVFGYGEFNTSTVSLVQKTGSTLSGASHTNFSSSSSITFNMRYIGQA